jgi:hypothetical protein
MGDWHETVRTERCHCGVTRFFHVGGKYDGNEFHPPHRCDPQFYVWCPEWGGTADGARMVRASTIENAAREWASQSDCDGDYEIIGNSEVVVHVREVGCDEVKAYRVSGEQVPEYYASEVELEEEESDDG